MRHTLAAVAGTLLLLASLSSPAMALEGEPVPTFPLVTVPSQQPTPTPTTTPASPPEEPAPAPAPAPAQQQPAQQQPAPQQPVQQLGPAVDPATGFVIDPATGYLVEPQTALLIEPGTGNLIDPATYLYTNFRLDFATGEVVEIEPTAEKPTAEPSSEEPQPSPTVTTTSPSPSPSETPPPTATSASPSPAAVDAEATAEAEEVPIGEHPLTRALVIALLIGLGVLYYAQLRSGSRT
ncbi:hypothetical protein GCM10009784_29220 [Arthrobacter parietis]|uniref:Uncharacterized protein n=1 Tax=Arthrobacter parietis TaxID=271434 RepID=A0ABN3B186_9MICC